MAMSLQSDAYANGSEMPARYTCEGDDVSPPLRIGDVPAGTRSLALIVDDPDAPDPAAPKRVWGHWVMYNLPPGTGELAEGIAPSKLPPGTRQGRNDWKRTGWSGPCPPIGRHRYIHTLYALDVELPDLHEPDKVALREAMEGHVIATAELIGTYRKRG